MDEGQLATWELTKQHESITPANLWTVTRITEDREEIATKSPQIEHWDAGTAREWMKETELSVFYGTELRDGIEDAYSTL